MKSLHRTAFTAAFLLTFALPARALAAVKGPNEGTPVNLGNQAQQHAASTGSGGSFFRMLFGLLVVVGVIYGVYWVLKKVKEGKEERASGTGLSTIATLPLGPNRSLHMVRAGGEIVILGVGEAGVTPIRTYTEEEALEAGLIGVEPEDFEVRSSPFAVRGDETANGEPRTANSALKQLLDNLRDATVRR